MAALRSPCPMSQRTARPGRGARATERVWDCPARQPPLCRAGQLQAGKDSEIQTLCSPYSFTPVTPHGRQQLGPGWDKSGRSGTFLWEVRGGMWADKQTG